MSTRSVLLGSSAPPYTVDFRGKTYAVRKLDEKTKGKFSTWLIQRTRRVILALYAEEPEQLKAELERLNDEALAGDYEWESEIVLGRPVETGETAPDGKPVKALQGGVLTTRQGFLVLSSILCDCTVEDVTGMLADDLKRLELLSVLELVIAESIPGFKLRLSEATAEVGGVSS